MDTRFYFAEKAPKSDNNVSRIQFRGYAIRRDWCRRGVTEWLYTKARNTERLCMWRREIDAKLEGSRSPSLPGARIEIVLVCVVQGVDVEFIDSCILVDDLQSEHHRSDQDALHVFKRPPHQAHGYQPSSE